MKIKSFSINSILISTVCACMLMIPPAANACSRVLYVGDDGLIVTGSREAVASVMSVIRNISVPRGFKDPSIPNISSTIWRSVFDHKNLVYYYEPTSSPNVFWVSLKKLNFKKGASVMKLELENGNRILAGDASDKFEKTKPFKFITDQK